MNEWEKKVYEELCLRGYTTEYAKHVAAFAGSLYLKKFDEVRETMDVLSFIMGIYV